jgi:NAD(P)H dehydrogenase (quinone)
VILVTGANGPFGRAVVEQLLTRVPPGELAVSVRDASRFDRPGVTVREGDFDRPASLDFSGADVVLVNGTNYGAAPAVRAQQQAAAITAARVAGARVVVTSWPDLERSSLPAAADYPATEALVRARPGPWTIVRLTYGMAASLARDVRMARTELVAPAGTARATPAHVDDLAEAVAGVLTSSGHDGRTYELTGPDAITWDDLAGLAGVPYRAVSDDEFRALVRATGFPEAAIEALIEYYQAFRSGWAATPSTDLEALLGRRPTRSLDAVRHAVATWAWS